MKRNETKRLNAFLIVLFIITGFYIAFIWLHSAMNADASGGESLYVLKLLNDFLRFIGLSAQMTTDHIVRKSAHFCEFALLGCLCMWCSFLFNRKKVITGIMPCGFFCLFVAVTDEYIQLFSEGRSSEVKDVLLDFIGSICGVVFFIIIILIILLIKKRKRR